MKKQVECSNCNGNKQSFVIACGSFGCKPMTMKCFRCEGSGLINSEMLEWIEKGKKLKQQRLDMNLSLREAAQRMDLMASHLSKLEQGKEDPTHFLINP